jgi:hypothetical protein
LPKEECRDATGVIVADVVERPAGLLRREGRARAVTVRESMTLRVELP